MANWKLPVKIKGLDRTYQQHEVHPGLVFCDRSTAAHEAAGAYEYVDSARLVLYVVAVAEVLSSWPL